MYLNTHSVCTLWRIWVCKPLKDYFFVNLSILMVFLGTSSCASGHKKTFFQVLCFYLLVRTQDVCYTNRLMRTIQKSSLWWSFLLLQRIYEDFFVGTWKCPHNLNRPHFAGVYTYECPHRCAKVHAHAHTPLSIWHYPFWSIKVAVGTWRDCIIYFSNNFQNEWKFFVYCSSETKDGIMLTTPSTHLRY